MLLRRGVERVSDKTASPIIGLVMSLAASGKRRTRIGISGMARCLAMGVHDEESVKVEGGTEGPTKQLKAEQERKVKDRVQGLKQSQKHQHEVIKSCMGM
jgi:hypothetical protein